MENPYAILGVDKNATKEEIRRAYLELVKKYHPDQYQDNPLSDLAEEKLKEINEAYEYLMAQPETSDNYSMHNNQYSYGHNDLQQVRMHLQNGNLDAAAAALNQSSAKNAEWYFLSGLLAFQRGWYNQAYDNFQTAYQMEPHNPEYSAALNRMQGVNQQYRTTAQHHGYRAVPVCSSCDCCSCLVCSDCCCECAGGDLIDCC